MLFPLANPGAVRRRACALLLLAGVAFRLLHQGEHGSDVLTVTHSAIDLVAQGLNPYGHGYLSSLPPGAPYDYGPLALVWYAILPQNVELLASVAVLFILAAAERLIGLAVCALWLPLAILANDGSNDSSVGLLLLGVLVLAERSPRWGAAALAAVAGFKPYALAFLPPLVAFGGLGVLVPFGLATVAVWSPAVAWWGLGNIVTSFRMAMDIHELPWFSLAAILQLGPASRGMLALLQLGGGLVASIGSLFAVHTARAMAAWGVVIFAATLYTGWWSSIAYLGAVIPILAWHVDAWYRDSALSQPVARLLGAE